MLQTILFAPLVAAFIAGFAWRIIGGKAAQVLAAGLLFLAAILSWLVFLTFDGQLQQIHILRFIESATLSTDWGVRLDRLSAIMLVLVTTVSSLVHLYSFGALHNDAQFKEGETYKPRFLAYLSFFTFAMLLLVTADNLVQLLVGWQGVSVASYLLIGFYYRKPAAGAAAIKAFVVNRVADLGFVLAIFGLFYLTDSLKMDDIFTAAPKLAQTRLDFLWTDWNAANLLALLLCIGALGKSAQIFLHRWLADAMQSPTPAAAIHATAMVTAGVFLVCRMSPLLEYAPLAMTFIVITGATTAFFAASVALVQTDIKRLLAYSTCSQLGFMFVAVGVGAYSVAMLHLFSFAFFNTLLFLGAGSVIHAMQHGQDLRNYGALRKRIPLTYYAMLIGTLAITGVGISLTTIGFAGFLSSGAMIQSTFGARTQAGNYAFWLLLISGFMTSFYSWRLMFMTFFGKARGDKEIHEQARESPLVMLLPLGVLAMGAIFAGMLWLGPFFGDHDEINRFFGLEPAQIEASGQADTDHIVATVATAPTGAIFSRPDNHLPDNARHAPNWVKILPFIAMVLGLVLAWWFYIINPKWPARFAKALPWAYRFLLNEWYFEWLYDRIFVKPAIWLGEFLWEKGDGKVIDGAINAIALGLVPSLGKLAGRMQNGYILTYALAMLIGVVVLLGMVLLGGGR